MMKFSEFHKISRSFCENFKIPQILEEKVKKIYIKYKIMLKQTRIKSYLNIID